MTLRLSSDELRVAIAVPGGHPPDALDGGWSPEDRPVADTVALRSLLARAMATMSGTAVRLLDETAELVTTMADAHTLVELRRDATADSSRWLLADVVLCVEERPETWRVEWHEDVDELTGDCVDRLPAETAPGPAVSLRTSLLVEAERRSTTGGVDQVAGALAAGGLSRGQADLVACVLADLSATVTLRCAHRDGSTTTAAALTWLETTSHVWLAVPAGGERDQPEEIRHTELRPADRATVEAELRDVLGLARVGSGR
jgi:hypothetical protein